MVEVAPYYFRGWRDQIWNGYRKGKDSENAVNFDGRSLGKLPIIRGYRPINAPVRFRRRHLPDVIFIVQYATTPTAGDAFDRRLNSHVPISAIAHNSARTKHAARHDIGNDDEEAEDGT